MTEKTCPSGLNKFCQKTHESKTGVVVRFFPKTLNMIQALFTYLTCQSILIGIAWFWVPTDAKQWDLLPLAFATRICAMGQKSSDPNQCLPSLLPCWQSSSQKCSRVQKNVHRILALFNPFPPCTFESLQSRSRLI